MPTSTSRPLSLFISSKMQELAEERRVVQAVLSDYRMYGWLWEDDAGACPTPTRATFLKEVEACDIYLGLFWLDYGPYTIEEYQYAHQWSKPCLVYKKQVDMDKRDPQLTRFLKQIEDVDNSKGVTVCPFTTTEELATHVQEDVLHLLTSVFRESRQQPANKTEENGTTGRTLSPEEQDELTALLLKCAAISDRAQREAVIRRLTPDIRQRIDRGKTDLTDVSQIVNKCAEYEGGIEQLVRATRAIDGYTRSVKAVIAFLKELRF